MTDETTGTSDATAFASHSKWLSVIASPENSSEFITCEDLLINASAMTATVGIGSLRELKFLEAPKGQRQQLPPAKGAGRAHVPVDRGWRRALS